MSYFRPNITNEWIFTINTVLLGNNNLGHFFFSLILSVIAENESLILPPIKISLLKSGVVMFKVWGMFNKVKPDGETKFTSLFDMCFDVPW